MILSSHFKIVTKVVNNFRNSNLIACSQLYYLQARDLELRYVQAKSQQAGLTAQFPIENRRSIFQLLGRNIMMLYYKQIAVKLIKHHTKRCFTHTILFKSLVNLLNIIPISL